MKLLLCIFIIVLSFGAGFLKANTYKNRVHNMNQLMTTFQLMEMEMNYGRTYLSNIFLRLSKQELGLASIFMEKLEQQLNSPAPPDLVTAWQCALYETYENTSLTEADLKILMEAGNELGRTDMENQKTMFQRIEKLLQFQLEEALQDQMTKGRMYKSIGGALGVLIVIILI